MKNSFSPSNLKALSNEQLDRDLRTLQDKCVGDGREIDELQTAVQELQVHRIELEMQNRSMREMHGELEHALQCYADLYDNLPLPYLTIASTGEITAANSAAIEWLRTDRRGLVGRFLGKFLDPYDAGRFAAHLESCLGSGGPLTIELTLRPPGGGAVPVQFSTRRAPMRTGGVQHAHVAITDLSKLKQAQAVLDEVNREQEAFNYSISHDLRAPLVTINNYAGIVLSDFSETMDPQAKAMVERMRIAAQRMEETLKRLLEYSAVSRAELVSQAVNVDAVVTDLLIQHRAQIEERNADVLIDRPLPTVRAARETLSQVVSNLLTNALKYTAPGESPKVHIFAETTDTRVQLHVVDQGIGIDPKFHERIFKVFERLHGYSRYPGSGVGLAIAKRAVERMSGKIWCESEPGKGACFIVELPRA